MVHVWCRAPATVMLFGEHSILREGCAVVAAVDAYLTVELEKRSDDQIHIHSDLGDEITSLGGIKLSSKFRFVESVLQSLKTICTSGFNCTIKSDFSPVKGLGSSAAVTVALIGAIETLFNFSESLVDMHKRALNVVQSVQGRGSGADLAASLLGGVVAYTAKPEVTMRRIADSLDLTVLFSGYKTPTADVIQRVEESEKEHPELIEGLLHLQASIALNARDSIIAGLLDNLRFLTQASHSAMTALGVSDATLDQLIGILLRDPGIKGAKISGSGLGDCVIGFGKLQNKLTLPSGCELIPVKVSSTGLVTS